MSNKVELNKNGRPVGWHGQSWTYYKEMMLVAFEGEEVLDVATGTNTISDKSSEAEKKTYNTAAAKLKRIILASLSMELGQRVMLKKNGKEMWDYLVNYYEGKTNAATRTNQEIILYNKLQTTKCKPNWDVAQHVDNMFMIREQLTNLSAGVRDPIFTQMLIRSLPSNARFDRLKSMVEVGDEKVDTPEKVKDQILRMDSFNKCDRELGHTAGTQSQGQSQGQGLKNKGQQNGNNGGNKQKSPEKTAAIAAMKADRKQGNCFVCHKQGHQSKDCPEKSKKSGAGTSEFGSGVAGSGAKQATYTRRKVQFADKVSVAEFDLDGSLTAEQPHDEPVKFTATGDSVAAKKSAVEQRENKGNSPVDDHEEHPVWEWCFDNASNVHVASDLRYFSYYRPFGKDEETDSVRGFQKKFMTTPVGIGDVQLIVRMNKLDVAIYLKDVFFVPDSMNLLSHSQAEDQGYTVKYQGRRKKVYELWKGNQQVLAVGRNSCGLYTFDAQNAFLPKNVQESSISSRSSQRQAIQTSADGVADLQRWHERLGHLCPQYVKIMADRGLVTGMTLRQRVFADCEACHMGKERKPSPLKRLERGITQRNQVIFADLLFPCRSNSTSAYKAVLVVVDGYSRFTTVYPLRSKNAEDVNEAMRRYIAWAERQFRNCPVQRVITDNGGEFDNAEMQEWYREQGIAFLPNPPKSSHLNLCERAHQTLTHMMKTMMVKSRLPKSMWVHALEMATFIRNRSYCQAIRDTPYYKMYGKRPDLHRIKTFGSIAYAYKPITPSRRKIDDNCRIGFLVGYPEGQAGCKVYFPTEQVVQHVLHVVVNEEIMYGDRYREEYDDSIMDWLSRIDPDDAYCYDDESASSAGDGDLTEDVPMESVEEENGDAADVDPELPDYDDLDEMPPTPPDAESDSESDGEHVVGVGEWEQAPMHSVFPSRRPLVTASRPDEGDESGQEEGSTETGDDSSADPTDGDDPPDDNTLEMASDESEEEGDAAESSAEGDVDQEDHDNRAERDTDHSQVTRDDAFDDAHDDEQSNLEEKPAEPGETSPPDPFDVNQDGGVDVSQVEDETTGETLTSFQPMADLDVSEAYTTGTLIERQQDQDAEHHDFQVSDNGMDTYMVPEMITGARRSSAQAELDDVLAAKRQRYMEDRPRMNLRSAAERKPPRYLEDYHVNATYHRKSAEGSNGDKQWHIRDVQIPKSFKEAMETPQKNEWYAGMQRELEAMFSKGVLELIDESELPSDAHALGTMWRFQAKTNDKGFVIRYRPRLVGLGNQQIFGVDYVDTFSPVARMMTFRVVVSIAGKMRLVLYQGDIDTAYLNAGLKIRQYVRRIPGFPCAHGKLYRVDQALYGLHQSGAEWYEEVDKWLKSENFQNTQTEPCLYFYCQGGVFAILLLYVDDVVLGTNEVGFKTMMFAKIHEKYGFKDGGVLHHFLGVQVDQDEHGIRLHQSKYCNEVMERFGFDDAHASATPMETNAKFLPQEGEPSDESDAVSFDYRGAIGALMYLATSTRPDIAFAVGYLSRFVNKPSRKHCGAVKRIFRYLAGTRNMGIYYSIDDKKADNIVISGHCDADWGNDPETRKSVTGFVLTIGGGAVAWAARRQTIVAQSTAEAEYVAMCEAAMEGRGIVNMLDEILPRADVTMELTMGVDNSAALAMAQKPTYNSRTRHIELRWHYVREQIKLGLMKVEKVPGTENPADMFTKALSKHSLQTYRAMIGMTTDAAVKDDGVPALASEGEC